MMVYILALGIGGLCFPHHHIMMPLGFGLYVPLALFVFFGKILGMVESGDNLCIGLESCRIDATSRSMPLHSFNC